MTDTIVQSHHRSASAVMATGECLPRNPQKGVSMNESIDVTFRRETPAAGSPPLRAQDLLLKLIDVATEAINRDSTKAQSTLERALAFIDGGAGTRGAPFPCPTRGGLAPWQAKRVATYIQDNIGLRLRAQDLAAAVRLSPGHFHRVFKATFRETLTAYIIRQRVRAAQKLMLSTSQSLSHVALHCGLYDQAHLTRLFRRIVGESPAVWRRQFGYARDEAPTAASGH
jgi:AraC-like DNA-binding protein